MGLANVVVNCLGTSAMFGKANEDFRRLIAEEDNGILFVNESEG
jgi:hypothetical protein